MSKRPNTTAEGAALEAQKLAQTNALQYAQKAQVLEKQLEKLCDALIQAGTEKETLLEYYPQYQTPAERLEIDKAHAATQPPPSKYRSA